MVHVSCEKEVWTTDEVWPLNVLASFHPDIPLADLAAGGRGDLSYSRTSPPDQANRAVGNAYPSHPLGVMIFRTDPSGDSTYSLLKTKHQR